MSKLVHAATGLDEESRAMGKGCPVERFGQKVRRAGVIAAIDRLLVTARRDEQDRNYRVPRGLAQAFANFDAVHAGEIDVEQHHVRRKVGKYLEGVLTAAARRDGKTRLLHDLRGQQQKRCVVVDNQNSRYSINVK